MKKKSKKIIVIVLIISILVSLCGIVIQYVISGNSKQSEQVATPLETPTPTASIQELKDYETTLYIFQQETKCLFTGSVDNDGKAIGDGHYEIFNNDGTKWCFDGKTHNKNLWSGYAKEYPMKFGNSDVQYSCKYSGDIESGIPNGTGTLRVEGTGNNDFTYIGGWKDGLYEGYGELIYDNPLNLNSIGNFEKGIYKPDFMQLIDILYTKSMVTISDADKNYIESVEENIMNHDTEGLYFGSGFNFDKYKESQENKDNRWFSIHITIANLIEYPESIFGMPVTEIVGYSYGATTIFHGFYFGHSDKLVKGESVKMSGYPVGYGPYSSLSEQKAVNFVACSVME